MFAFLLLLSSGAPELVNAAPMPETGDRMVCRSARPTGSRVARRVCLLQRDIDARSSRDQAEIKGMVDADQPNPVGKN